MSTPDAPVYSVRDAVIYFGLTTFVVHELMWLGCNIPYLVIERYGLFRRYKLQPKVNNYIEMRRMFVGMLKEHVLFVLPTALVSSIVLRDRLAIEWQRLPTLGTFLLQLLTTEVVHDLSFYVIHWWLHTSWAYARIHKVHHENTAPYALASEHAHWFETVFGFIGPLVFGLVAVSLLFNTRVHMVLVWSTVFVQLLHSVEGHCGYELPWHKDRWPIFAWFNGGARHHDGHHAGFNYNFGARWTDLLFRSTETHYRTHMARRFAPGLAAELWKFG